MSKIKDWWNGPKWPTRTRWIMRTQPPLDGSADKGAVAYLRRDRRSAWRTANPILADREVAYEIDTDILKKGDGKTPWTELPPYYRTDPAPSS